MACASGCSLLRSALAARRSTASRSRGARVASAPPSAAGSPPSAAAAVSPSSSAITSVSVISPVVRVPVLSKTTVSTSFARSRISPPLNRTPFSRRAWSRPSSPRASPVRARRDRRSAPARRRRRRPRTRTSTARPGRRRPVPTGGSAPTTPEASRGRRNQTSPQKIALRMTAGTKYAEMRSARFWISGCRDCASLTVWTIPCRAVSSPTLVASTVNTPFSLIVEPILRRPLPSRRGPTRRLPSTRRPRTGRRRRRRPSESSLPADLHPVADFDLLEWHLLLVALVVDQRGRLGLHLEASAGLAGLPFERASR